MNYINKYPTMDWKKSLSDKGVSIVDRWLEPCRAMFDALANHSPTDLASLVRSRTLDPADLTFAAETLGQTNVPDAIEILKDLVLDDTISPLVKEGALYGLYHLDCDLTDILVKLSNCSSQALSSIATCMLKTYENRNDN
jgi:HEAT repeat protein